MRIKTPLFLAATVASQLAAQEAKGTGTVVLRAARVIDGTGAAPIQNGVVVVTEWLSEHVVPVASISIAAT